MGRRGSGTVLIVRLGSWGFVSAEQRASSTVYAVGLCHANDITARYRVMQHRPVLFHNLDPEVKTPQPVFLTSR